MKMIFTAVFLFVPVSLCADSSTACQLRVRIKGGNPANITSCPYMLAIEVKRYNSYHFICGATIIHQNWAVTAGSCGVTTRRNLEVGVRLRSGISRRYIGLTLTNPEKLSKTIHNVEKVIFHPQYDISRNDYDVSIIKVSTPFHFSDAVQSILMATEPPFAKTAAVVSGWGWESATAVNASHYLRQAKVYIVDYKTCKQRIPDLTPRMLCAEDSVRNMDISCPIDDGGPLVADYRLVGIATMYWLRDRSKCHGVYTDVSQISPWVTSTIKTEST